MSDKKSSMMSWSTLVIALATVVLALIAALTYWVPRGDSSGDISVADNELISDNVGSESPDFIDASAFDNASGEVSDSASEERQLAEAVVAASPPEIAGTNCDLQSLFETYLGRFPTRQELRFSELPGCATASSVVVTKALVFSETPLPE